MRFRISLDTAMKATQIAVAPLACWPRERDASFITNLKHNLVWWIVMAHLVFTYYTFGAEILQYKHDFDHIIPIIANTACATSSVTKMIICRIQETNIQVRYINFYAHYPVCLHSIFVHIYPVPETMFQSDPIILYRIRCLTSYVYSSSIDQGVDHSSI